MTRVKQWVVPGLVGDEVVVAHGQKTRDFKDGDVVRIVGFDEVHYGPTENYGHAPGVYSNCVWAEFETASGSRHGVHIGYLEPLPGVGTKTAVRERLRDLPEARFWPDDIVEDAAGRKLRICTVHYSVVESVAAGRGYDDRAFAAEPIDGSGWVQEYSEGQLTLVDRGNVWKFYNGQEPAFDSVKDEVLFHKRIGLCDEIRNDQAGGYAFSWEQAQSVIDRGDADFTWGGSRLGWDDGGNGQQSLHLYKLRDRDLAERYRASLLAEPVAPAPGM